MNELQVNVDIAGSRDLVYIRLASEFPLSDLAIADILESLVTKIREGNNEQPTETADPGTNTSDKVR